MTAAPVWFEIMVKLWPVILVFSTLIGSAAAVWLTSRFALRSEHEALKNTVSGHSQDLGYVHEALRASPTRQELQEDIAQLGERMSGVESSMRGVKDQLGTANNYLHTLVEKSLK